MLDGLDGVGVFRRFLLGIVPFAQLLADDPQLFPEEVVPLIFVHGLLDLAVNILLQPQDVYLLGQQLNEHFQPLDQVPFLQHGLFVLHLEVEVLDNFVKKPGKALLGVNAADNFPGHFGDQIAVFLEPAQNGPEQGLAFLVGNGGKALFSHGFHFADHKRAVQVHLDHGRPVKALHHNPNGIFICVQHLDDFGHDPHTV